MQRPKAVASAASNGGGGAGKKGESSSSPSPSPSDNVVCPPRRPPTRTRPSKYAKKSASAAGRQAAVLRAAPLLVAAALMVGWWRGVFRGAATVRTAPARGVVVPTSNRVDAAAAFGAVYEEFYERYGGRQQALAVWNGAVKPVGSMQATSIRMLEAAAEGRPFVLSFAGYSVTVGRGNRFEQSFPFVVERILRPVVEEALGNTVTVRNAAIGGIPSFPYGFCFRHFLGADADVVSWDYSMNEGRGAAVLEAYVRQATNQLPHRPAVILLDNNQARCDLLHQYAKRGLLQDGMCVGMAKDVVDKKLLALPEEQRPPGYRRWDEFGAPKSCPGRGSWHPKLREHEWIGWMVAMYFVRAAEIAAQIMARDSMWRATYGARKKKTTRDDDDDETGSKPLDFPAAIQTPPAGNDPQVTELLYGHAMEDSSGDEFYRVKNLQCRTNFLPATDQDKVLPSIVVSGLAPGVSSDNIMEERSDAAYQSGWVLDVSKVERDTKEKVERCGGLGYVDMKIALYGIPASGTLRLWLPVTEHDHHDDADETAAGHWFDNIILCEANEKRPDGACQLDTDLEIAVGGVPVTSLKMIAGAAEYLKRKTCVHVGVPPAAVVTKLRDVRSADNNKPLTADARRLLTGNPEDVGLIVDIKAKSNVSRDKGACCISHVVWEQH